MIACTIPFLVTDDSDALRGSTSDMALNIDSYVIYVSGTPTSVELNIQTVPDGKNASEAKWDITSIGDGEDCVTLSADMGETTTVSANAFGDNSVVKSVEVTAFFGDSLDTATSYASAVIVVYASSSAAADAFHFYVKIDSGAVPSSAAPQSAGFTDGTTLDKLYEGFWIEVAQTQYNTSTLGASLGDWNALNAFRWYCSTYGWEFDASGYGWISTLLNLGTYQGSGNSWIYWSQFYANDGSWVFSNTTMGYITSTSQSYLGLLFRVSESASSIPAFPGYPIAA